MFARTAFLFASILVGAAGAALLATRLARIESGRLARGYLVAVALAMGVRVAAYVAANVFGLKTVRPASTGPYDLTNLLIGAAYGLAAVDARRARFGALWCEPEVLLALRLATGVAFVLAGLVNVFTMTTGAPDYFVLMGYPKTFHYFMLTAEVLGGAALLLPWRWLTLVAAAGLTIDMFGALYTQLHAGQPLDAAAFAMLLRLVPLVVLSVRGRWTLVAAGAVACLVVAVAGATLLQHPPLG